MASFYLYRFLVIGHYYIQQTAKSLLYIQNLRSGLDKHFKNKQVLQIFLRAILILARIKEFFELTAYVWIKESYNNYDTIDKK